MEHALVKYDNLALYLREIGKFKPLSREEEFELASRYYRKRDISALKRLIMSNLRFVVKIALEYRKYRVNISDVIQEGNIGILKAAWRFNPFKGVRFISYAVYWIRAQIHDYILRTWHIVKIGTTQLQRKLFYRLLSSQKRLLRRIGDETEIETAYLPTGATGDDALAMDMRMSSAAVSLDAPSGDSARFTLHNTLASGDEGAAGYVERKEFDGMISEKLSAAMEALSDRERYVLQNRYLTETPATLEEIGARFGVSKERARQIEEQAKKNLRKHLPSDFRLTYMENL